jgi:hypothetical protein
MSLVLEVDNLSCQAQTIESLLTNPQALDSQSKCKVALLEVRYQGRNDT